MEVSLNLIAGWWLTMWVGFILCVGILADDDLEYKTTVPMGMQVLFVPISLFFLPFSLNPQMLTGGNQHILEWLSQNWFAPTLGMVIFGVDHIFQLFRKWGINAEDN